MADGGWRMADGGWRMADGSGQMVNGESQIARFENDFVLPSLTIVFTSGSLLSGLLKD